MPQSALVWMAYSLFGVFWLLIPFAFAALCRLFGVRLRWLVVWLSAGLFVAAWPLVIIPGFVFDRWGIPVFLLGYINRFHPDAVARDLIHALKTGFVIPLLVLSLGLPLLFPKGSTAKRT